MRSKEEVGKPYQTEAAFESVWHTWSLYFNNTWGPGMSIPDGWKLIRGGALYWRKVKRDAKA